MFSMLYEANFTYDSSMPIYDNKPPSFPYTLDYKGKEGLQPNPTKSINHTGMWGLINRSHGHVGQINQSHGHAGQTNHHTITWTKSINHTACTRRP